MSPLGPTTGACIGAALYLLLSRRVSSRVPVRRVPSAHSDEDSMLRRMRPLLAASSLLGGWAFFGGLAGLMAGVVAAGAAWQVLGSAEGVRERRRRLELEADLPVAVHLLGACLAAGAPILNALAVVGTAVGGSVGDEFASIRIRLVLGDDPVVVWRTVAEAGPLAPLGRRLARAHDSGASVTAAIAQLADDLRNEVDARTRARARSVEVRATAPLGICLLPSFVLLGVIPMTAGVFGSLHLLG